MEKEAENVIRVACGLLVFIMLFNMFSSSFVYAQTQQTQYSGFEKFVDNVKLFFAKGDNKVKLALEIREKELNSAIENVKAGQTTNAVKNLQAAKEKLKVVQEKVSPEVAGEIKLSISEITEKVMQSKDINPEFSVYLESHLNEEQKTQLSAELSEKISSLCEELAKQDFELMLNEPKCNPDNAPPWLKDKIKKEFKEMQEQVAQEMINQLTVCINDPRDCNCDKIPIASERTKCEKATSLAVRCEFQQDENACMQLQEMGPPELPSDMPDFLKPLFQKTIDKLIKNKEKEMFKKFAPKECVEAGVSTREACEAIMMEKFAPKECIDAGATTKEACEQIMFAIHGPPPTECMENGEFIGPEECEAKMIASGKIPQECIENGKPISREECEQKLMASGMIPPECIENGKPISEQECLEKMLPPPCKEAGAFTREACEAVMQNYQGPPIECLDEQGNFIGDEQCEKIMQERGFPPSGAPGMPMPRRKPGKEFIIPQECVGMTFEQCEQYLMKNYMPRECQEQGALTPEACQRVMLPQECKDANAFTREQCEAIMIKKNMPQECKEKNALTPEECGKIIAEKAPSECVVEGKLVSEEECGMRMAQSGRIPRACIVEGKPLSEQECHKIIEKEKHVPFECQDKSKEECEELMKNKFMENIPPPCREAGITNPNDCGRFLDREKRDKGIGINMPPECIGKTPEQCDKIMREKGIAPMPIPPKPTPERPKEMPTLPQECMDMGIQDMNSCEIMMSKINEERIKQGQKMIIDKEGNKDYITNDEINHIAQQAEKSAETQIDLTQAEEIKQDVQIIEQNIQDIEQQSQQYEEILEQRIETPEQIQEAQPEVTPAPEPIPESTPVPESAPSSEAQPEAAPEPQPEPTPEPASAPEQPAPEAPVTGEITKTTKHIPSISVLQKIIDFFRGL